METLQQISMGFLGLIIYNIFSLRKHLTTIHTASFWEAYKMSGKYMVPIWSFAFISSIAITIAISPDTSIAISQLTGMDIGNSNAAFFTMGLMTTSLADTK